MEIYQLKVTLVGTRPPIWRRLLVPADLKLGKLSDVLLAAMGWYGGHLHDFRIGGQDFGRADREARLMGLPEVNDEAKAPLSTVLGRVGATAVYTYDFGDGWKHRIVVEKILPADPDLTYPRCTGGKGACPPEDCGGVWGFYNLLKAISDPAHEDHDELLRWVGGSFDPDAFSVDSVNQMLTPSKRRRAKPQ